MKRLVLLLLAAMMILPDAAEAKRRETDEEIKQKTRHYKGWEWGASARGYLSFYELTRSKIVGEDAVKAYKTQAKFGGSAMLNVGYFIDNHWKVGAEIGAQIQYNHTVMPLYASVHYYYGKRKNCLFNFVNAGTNILFNKGLRFGATCAGGVGFRIQPPTSKYKIDIMLGYQALMMNPRPTIIPGYAFDKKDVNLKELNQSVFIGIGIAF